MNDYVLGTFRQLAEQQYPGAHHWLMECLFVQGRFADLRAVAQSCGAGASRLSNAATPEIADTIALWQGEEVAA